MERDFSLPSPLDSCLRRDMAGAPPSHELPLPGAIGRLRSRWPSVWITLNLYCEANAADGGCVDRRSPGTDCKDTEVTVSS